MRIARVDRVRQCIGVSADETESGFEIPAEFVVEPSGPDFVSPRFGRDVLVRLVQMSADFQNVFAKGFGFAHRQAMDGTRMSREDRVRRADLSRGAVRVHGLKEPGMSQALAAVLADSTPFNVGFAVKRMYARDSILRGSLPLRAFSVRE